MLRTALSLAVILAASPATGAERRPRGIGVHLEYQRAPRAEQCPGETELRGWVAAGLGHDPFTEAGPWRLITSINRRRDGAFIAVTTLFDDKGASASSLDPLVGRDCRYLVNTLLATRITVLLVDPPAPPAPPPAPPAPPAPPPVAPPTPDKLPRSQARTGFRFGLGTVLGFGAAPRAAVGLTADFGLYWPTASLPFDGVSLTPGFRWDPSAAGHVSGIREGARVSTSRALITVAPCVHWWKLYGCGVLGLGQLWGGGEGIAYSAQDSSPTYFVSGARLGVEVPFAPHLGLRVSGEVLGTTTTIAIPFNDQPGWTTPRASGSLGAGLYFSL